MSEEMNTNNDGFFERVQSLAKSKKISIDNLMKEALGEKSNRDFYNGLKRRGICPRADAAVKIAKVLGVTVEYLVTGE